MSSKPKKDAKPKVVAQEQAKKVVGQTKGKPKEEASAKDVKGGQSVKLDGKNRDSGKDQGSQGGKKAQKESKAQQKANEAVEKEKWRKTMMLESDDEEEEDSKLSDVDELAFQEGMKQALERTKAPTKISSATNTITRPASTSIPTGSATTDSGSENVVCFHEMTSKSERIIANFDSPIEPITPMQAQIEEEVREEEPRVGKKQRDSKKIALSRALVKKETGEILSNKERRALARLDEEVKAVNENDEATNDNNALLASLRNFSISDISVGKKIEESLTKDIIIERFSISAPQKPLFVQAELRLSHGHRYGLLGPNGQGKTTLLKHIAARALPIPSHIRVMYVEQEVEGSDISAVQTVLQADEKLVALLRTESELIATLIGVQADSLCDKEWVEKSQQLDQLELELEACQADTAEGRVRKILSGLGFTPAMQEQPTSILSGGWKMRVSLARALFVDPDLLLLDEPTNHLDLSAVMWLERHLQQCKGTLVVVSHDQEFLNNVVTNVLWVQDKILEYYRGDYDDFVIAHEARLAKQTKDFEKQQKALKIAKAKGLSKQEAEAKVPRQTVEASHKHLSGESDGVPALLTRVRDYVVDFQFPDPDDERPFLQITEMSFRHSTSSPLLFKKLSLGVNVSTRAVIVGPNGAGKTTLLNLLSGDLHPSGGDIRRDGGLRIGRYSQHFSDSLPMEQSPVCYLQSQFPEQKEQSLRRLLGRFGLEGTAHTIPLRNLSGGQKARVVFSSLVLRRPHILFLDEPTNHLDIESINALIKALGSFTGGVLLVSHDARLISSINAKIWICAGDGRLCFYSGNFASYRAQVLSSFSEVDAAQDKLAQNKALSKRQTRAELRQKAKRAKA